VLNVVNGQQRHRDKWILDFDALAAKVFFIPRRWLNGQRQELLQLAGLR